MKTPQGFYSSDRCVGLLLWFTTCHFLLMAQGDNTAASTFYNLARQKIQENNIVQGIQYLDSAAYHFKEIRNIERTIECQLEKCALLMELNQSTQALLDSCQNLMSQISNQDKRAEYQIRMLLLRQKQTSHDSLKYQYLAEASKIIYHDSTGLSGIWPRLFMEYGIYYFNRDQFDSCNYFMEKALLRLPATSMKEMEGDICLQWAKSLRRVGDMQKAKSLISRAIQAYADTLGFNHTKVATGYNDLAIVQNLTGDITASGNSFFKALKIREHLFGRHTNEYATVLNNATLYYLEIRKYDLALKYAKETISIFESIKAPDKRFHVASYNTLAKVYEAMNDLDNARQNFEKAVQLHQQYFPGNSRIRFYYIDLGKNAMLRGKFEEAVANFHLAMSVTIPGIDPRNLDNDPSPNDPSNYLSLKTLTLLKADALLELYFHRKDSTYLSHAIKLYDLADLFATKNRTEVQYQKSRIAFSKQNLTLYEGAIRANLQMWQITGRKKYLNRSFLLSEKSKSLTLLEDLLEVSALKSSDIPEEVLRQEESIQDSISYYRGLLIEAITQKDSSNQNSYQNKIFRLDLRYEDFKKSMEKNYPEFYRSKYELNFLSLDLVKDRLQSKQSFIEFFIGHENIFVFVANPTEIYAITVERPDSLENLVTQILKNIREYDFSKSSRDEENLQRSKIYEQKAYELYQLIWLPFQKYLTAEVVIVPDAVLNYLPFGVLLTQPVSPEMSYHQLPYLEREKIISYNYSATLGRQMEDSQPNDRNKFLVVAPEFDEDTSSALGALIFNTEEAKEISGIMDGQMLTGSQASKSQFLQNFHRYGSFHFATHAVVNEDDADLSFLAFQKSNDEKNQLYLQELYSIKLPAYVVTLSACQTNVGPLLQGEGIASLAKGFSYAGAKSIITSMWDVDDLSTKTIMTGFYRELAAHKNKNIALQKSKLDYLSQADGILAHPYFWATFIAIGDMSALNTQEGAGLTYGVVLLFLVIFVPLIILSKKRWIH